MNRNELPQQLTPEEVEAYPRPLTRSEMAALLRDMRAAGIWARQELKWRYPNGYPQQSSESV